MQVFLSHIKYKLNKKKKKNKKNYVCDPLLLLSLLHRFFSSKDWRWTEDSYIQLSCKS